MDYKEFSSKIKQKYPQYADMDDADLARRMVEKYPQYKDVTFDNATVEPKSAKKEGVLSGIGSDLKKRGSALMNNATREESFPEYAIQQGGEIAGGVNDVLGRVVAPIGRTLGELAKNNTPGLYNAGKATGNMIGRGINKAFPDLGRVMDDDSNQGETMRGIANMLMLGGVAKAVKPAVTEVKSGIKTAVNKPAKSVAEQIAKPDKKSIIFNEQGGIDLGKSDIPDIDELAKAEEYKVGKATNPILTKRQVKQEAGSAPKAPIGSGIDEREATVLSIPKQETSAPFTDYAIQAKRAMRGVDEAGNPVDTPMDLVGKRGYQAYEEIEAITKKAGEQKSEYIQKINDAAINNGEFISPKKLKEQFTKDLNDVLGAYNNKGKFEAAASGLKAEDLIPDAKKIFERIENLPNEITPEQLDSFSANLNKFLTERTKGELAPKKDQIDLMVGRLKDVINKELEGKATTVLTKQDFDNYLSARKNYGNMVKIQNELSGALGREVVPGSGQPTRGAAIMKRLVQSNAEAGSKVLSRAVKDLTGIDLAQEAHYADIAMRAANDPRMNNLLESVGLLKTIAGSKTGMAMKVAEAGFNKVRGSKLDRLIDYYNRAQKTGAKK